MGKPDFCSLFTFNVSLEPLAHCRYVASLVFCIVITLVVIHLNWLSWFLFLIINTAINIIIAVIVIIAIVINIIIQVFIPKSLSFHCFHAIERLQVFALRASVLGLISSLRLDGRKDIQSEKPGRSDLHAELEACILSPLQVNNNKHKTITHMIFIWRSTRYSKTLHVTIS